jgi:hypothetical protein
MYVCHALKLLVVKLSREREIPRSGRNVLFSYTSSVAVMPVADMCIVVVTLYMSCGRL